PVAVDVLDVEAVDRILVERIGTRGGADVLRLVRQRPFGAVGVDARADVDRARVEKPRDVRILAVAFLEAREVAEARRGGGELARVDVAVDPEGGLVGRRTRVRARYGHHPDVPPLVTLADALERKQPRVAGGESLQ